MRDWIARARHNPRQPHEGTSETGQTELVRLRADKHRLLRDALAIVASEATTNERGRR